MVLRTEGKALHAYWDGLLVSRKMSCEVRSHRRQRLRPGCGQYPVARCCRERTPHCTGVVPTPPPVNDKGGVAGPQTCGRAARRQTRCWTRSCTSRAGLPAAATLPSSVSGRAGPGRCLHLGGREQPQDGWPTPVPVIPPSHLLIRTGSTSFRVLSLRCKHSDMVVGAGVTSRAT